MLERIAHDNGVVTYQSALLRAAHVVHAFSTRIGGVSEGPYATLNLGTLEKGAHSDANTAVAENFRRFRRALGCERLMRVEARQVHGAAVWRPPTQPVKPNDAPEADALVTDQPGKLLTVRVADCVPVLMTSADGRAVAAVHAGWRGIVAGVVPAAVAAMRAQCGVAASDLCAAIGPAISAAHFEVGPDVAEAFTAAGLHDAVQHGRGPRLHIDLPGAVTHQLQAAGVAADRIDGTDACTYRDADTFFSHRRDGAPAGRLAAVIAPAPAGG